MVLLGTRVNKLAELHEDKLTANWYRSSGLAAFPSLWPGLEARPKLKLSEWNTGMMIQVCSGDIATMSPPILRIIVWHTEHSQASTTQVDFFSTKETNF